MNTHNALSLAMVIQGNKLQIVFHDVVLCTETRGTIKPESLPFYFPRHKSKKKRLKSSTLFCFTEQESNNKERRVFTSRMLFAVAILLLLLKPMPPISSQETFRHILQWYTSGQQNIKRGFVQLRYGSNFVGNSS